MTKEEALRLALEALEMFCEHGAILRPIETRDAIKAALEAKDEPVAFVHNETGLLRQANRAKGGDFESSHWTPLYTTPPQRTWVGLTDEEKAQFVVAYYPSNWDRKTAVSLMSDYEKYLKEKNNG